MANIKSAKKRVLQDAKARSANNSARSMVRTYIKKAFAVIDACDRDAAVKAVNEAQSVIVRVAHKRVIHPNAGSRQHARSAAAFKAKFGEQAAA